MPQEDCRLFLRRYWFCEEVKTLAVFFSASPRQLSGRLYRLRQQLKTFLEKEDIFP